MNNEQSSHWRSVIVAAFALITIIIIALYAPDGSKTEAYTAVSSIVTVVIMRHVAHDNARR